MTRLAMLLSWQSAQRRGLIQIAREQKGETQVAMAYRACGSGAGAGLASCGGAGTQTPSCRCSDSVSSPTSTLFAARVWGAAHEGKWMAAATASRGPVSGVDANF